jgi:hypothetical protein
MAASVFIDHCRFITNVIFRTILAPRGNILLSPCVITHVLIRVRNLSVSGVFTSPVTYTCAHPQNSDMTRLGCLG